MSSVLHQPSALWAGLTLILTGIAIALVLNYRPAPNLDLGPRRRPIGPAGSSRSRTLDRLIASTQSGRTLEALLRRAHIALQPGRFIIGVGFASISALLVGYLVGLGTASLLGLVLVPALSLHLVARRSRRMSQLFQDQLVDTLVTLSGSLQSGLGVMQAFQTVADRAAEPTATEFSRALAQTRIGSDPIQALAMVAERVKSPDFVWAVRAMKLNREVGGNLSEVLGTVAETIRERHKIADQVRVLSAEGRFSAWVLLALPFIVVGITQIISPTYSEVLYTTRIGLAVLGAALALMLTGAVWIKRMLRIEY